MGRATQNPVRAGPLKTRAPYWAKFRAWPRPDTSYLVIGRTTAAAKMTVIKISITANQVAGVPRHDGSEIFKKFRPKKLLKSNKSMSRNFFLNISHKN